MTIGVLEDPLGVDDPVADAFALEFVEADAVFESAGVVFAVDAAVPVPEAVVVVAPSALGIALEVSSFGDTFAVPLAAPITALVDASEFAVLARSATSGEAAMTWFVGVLAASRPIAAFVASLPAPEADDSATSVGASESTVTPTPVSDAPPPHPGSKRHETAKLRRRRGWWRIMKTFLLGRLWGER